MKINDADRKVKQVVFVANNLTQLFLELKEYSEDNPKLLLEDLTVIYRYEEADYMATLYILVDRKEVR